MNWLILALFEKLVGLYPPGFRADFGEELRQVFSQALADASLAGRFSAFGLICRELRDLPANLLVQHRAELQARRAISAAGAVHYSSAEEITPMTRRKTLMLLLLAAMGYAMLIPACTYGYTVFQLGLGRWEGVYPSPEAGMRAMIEKSYVGIQHIEIEYAGPNSFDGSNPHIWFVIAHVWTDRRADGPPLGAGEYEGPGSFFLKVHDGWIHRPEGSMPELIGLAMKVFHLEGQ